jgi:putative transposase
MIARTPAEADELKRRKQAVRWYLRGMRFTEICERLDRHSTWLSKWLKRYRQGGWEALRDRSRRPHKVRAQTPDAVVNEILALRRLFESIHDREVAIGAKAIQRVLFERRGEAPSISTIERVLRRRATAVHRRRAS